MSRLWCHDLTAILRILILTIENIFLGSLETSGSNPGSNPGSDPGSNSGSDPGSNPDSDPDFILSLSHLIRVLNERRIGVGGNFCPLWLVILKSV